MNNNQGVAVAKLEHTRTNHEQEKPEISEKVKYCLYARKSSESEERQDLTEVILSLQCDLDKF